MAALGFESTTDDVLAGRDLRGQRFLVTGASTGLGLETTRALAAHRASVVMAVRDLAKGATEIEGCRPVADALWELSERLVGLAPTP